MHGQFNCLHIRQRSTDRSIRAMSYNLILFFEAGDTQEGVPCFEVTEDTIEDKQIQHTATHLNTLASSPVKIDALNRELKFYDPIFFLLNGFIKGFLFIMLDLSCWIHHLSYPKNESVNALKDPKLYYVKYASFDEAVAIAQELGKGFSLGKTDVKSTLELSLWQKNEFDQLGFCFNNWYYFI